MNNRMKACLHIQIWIVPLVQHNRTGTNFCPLKIAIVLVKIAMNEKTKQFSTCCLIFSFIIISTGKLWCNLRKTNVECIN